MFTLNTTTRICFSSSVASIHPLLPDKCVPGPELLLKNISSLCGCKANSQNMNILPLRKFQQQRLREEDEQNGSARVRRFSDFVFQ